MKMALPREEEIKLVSVPVFIHLKRLADIFLGSARKSYLENEGRLYIDLEGGNLQLDGTHDLFGKCSCEKAHFLLYLDNYRNIFIEIIIIKFILKQVS